ncbi:MAG: phage portal protein [Chloroflexi bacterium]|nr:phage portal protein [Chloroflexota bacterium]
MVTIPQTIARLDLPRLRSYRECLDFYNGLQWPATPRRRERRLTVNYAKAFVEKVTSYLMTGLSFSFDPLPTDSPDARHRARRAEEALYQVYEANHLEQLDFDTELDTAILGDGCFKVTWDETEKRVRVSAPDVQGLFAWWLGDDVSRLWRVASRYQLTAEEAEALHGITPPASPWKRPEVIIVEVWTDDHFQLWADNRLVESRPNPYPFIPFVIFPNLREPKKFWGLSDIPTLVEPARELNRALSQLSLILELSGNPIAVLENVEDARDIAVQPGAVWELPERARAYLLDLLQGGGIGLHVDYINLIYRVLHDLSESPRTAFGDNQRGLSGIALEMELHPLLQRVRRKRLIRTAAYQRRNHMILRLLEQMTGETYLPLRPHIVWGPVLPQDRSRLVQEETALVAAGVHSRRRAMTSLGVENPEVEWQRWLGEREGEQNLSNGSQ